MCGSAGGPSCMAPLRFFLTWSLAWVLPLDLNQALLLFSCPATCYLRLLLPCALSGMFGANP